MEKELLLSLNIGIAQNFSLLPNIIQNGLISEIDAGVSTPKSLKYRYLNNKFIPY